MSRPFPRHIFGARTALPRILAVLCFTAGGALVGPGAAHAGPGPDTCVADATASAPAICGFRADTTTVTYAVFSDANSATWWVGSTRAVGGKCPASGYGQLATGSSPVGNTQVAIVRKGLCVQVSIGIGAGNQITAQSQ